MPTARLPIDAAHRAASSDAHAIGAVTGLTAALAGKAAVAHETALTGVHGIVLANGQSVGLGPDALKDVSTSTGATCVGYRAGYKVTSAQTTLIGHYAGGNNLTAQVTAIGYQAAVASTVAITAIGHMAAVSNTTGDTNTAIGYQAMRYATGKSNTAIGDKALYGTSGASTGNGNTAIGYQAASSLTTGNNNTAIGSQAASLLTIGGTNTAIGFRAGMWFADGTTPNQNSVFSCYIGNETKASVAGVVNETAIGDKAIGGGSNTVRLGNSSVTAWLPGATNKVAIGSATLAFKEQYMTDGTNTWKLTVDATGPVWTSL
jgi:hypothetical protein